MKILIALALLTAAPAFAKDLPISWESETYPSPASLILSGTQSALAGEAIKACGGKEKVKGLSQIQINVSAGLGDEPVASVEQEKFGPGLMLFYPLMKATAVAHCLD